MTPARCTTSPTGLTRSPRSTGTRAASSRRCRRRRRTCQAPPLVVAPFAVELVGHRRGAVVPRDPRLSAVRLGDARIEGEEPELLRALSTELDRLDPDVLLSDDGDGFDLPWLYERARANGLTPRTFSLGRLPAPLVATSGARTFVSYGRIYHRPAAFPLPGRFHVDRESSFVYDDAASTGSSTPPGSRGSRSSRVARQSPGTCFTAMEMAHRLRRRRPRPVEQEPPRGVSSRPGPLVDADRGGVILLPPAGVHDLVDEFDFASLYPHIMVRHNLSAETLECACCPNSPRARPGARLPVVPEARRADPADPRAAPRPPPRLEAGRRPVGPPRGRAPEGVAAGEDAEVGARDRLRLPGVPERPVRPHRVPRGDQRLRARPSSPDLIPFAESRGVPGPPRPRRLALARVPAGPGAPARPPGVRRSTPPGGSTSRWGTRGGTGWIVFLRAVTHGFGVPNRYYGRYEGGEFKLRGIGLPAARHADAVPAVRGGGARDAGPGPQRRRGAGARSPPPRARRPLRRGGAEAARGHARSSSITHRVARRAEEFVAFTDTAAALRQLQDAGVERGPGETVRYLVAGPAVAFLARPGPVAELLTGDERYDADAYLELLARRRRRSSSRSASTGRSSPSAGNCPRRRRGTGTVRSSPAPSAGSARARRAPRALMNGRGFGPLRGNAGTPPEKRR